MENIIFILEENKLFLDINNTYKKIEVNLLEGRLIVKPILGMQKQ